MISWYSDYIMIASASKLFKRDMTSYFMGLFTVIPRFIISGYKDKEKGENRLAEDMKKVAGYINHLNENQMYLYKNVRELREGFRKVEETHKLTHKILVEIVDLAKEENKVIGISGDVSDSKKIASDLNRLNTKHDNVEKKIKSIEKKINDELGEGKDVDFLADYISVLHDNQKKIVKKLMEMTSAHDVVNARVRHIHSRTIEMIKDVERLLDKEDVVERMRNNLEKVSSHTNLHSFAITNVRRRLSEVEKMKGSGSEMLEVFTDNEKRVILAVSKAKKPLSYTDISVTLGFKEKTIQKLVSSIMKRSDLLQSKVLGKKKQKFFWIDSKDKKEIAGKIGCLVK